MEHLIDVDGSLGRTPKVVRTVVASVAALVILATGALEAFDPPPLPRLKGKEGVELRTQIHEAAFWDGTKARWFERNFRLRGNVRRRISSHWAYAMYQLGDVPVDKVIAGKDGWLFLRNRVTISGDHLPQGLAIATHHFTALGRQLAAIGSTLVAIPLPRKAVACQSMLRQDTGAALGFDRELIEAFKDKGILTVDVLDAWLGMPPEDVYKVHDTHWAPPARIEVARELRDLIPEFQKPEFEAWIGVGPRRNNASLLFQVGLSGRSRLFKGIQSGVENESLLFPGRIKRKIASGEIPTRAILVGSSFSAGFKFSELLVGLLCVGIEDASEEGTEPFVSMDRALSHRSPEEIPPYVLAEFPLHQAASFTPSWNPAVASATRLYLAMGQHVKYEPLSAIASRSNDEETKKGVAKVRFKRGTLFSSGDGVLSIRLEIEGESPSKWQLRTSGAHLVFTLPAGANQVTLPLIEGADPTGSATLWPLNAAGSSAKVRATVVADVDLTGGTPLVGSRSDDGTWSFVGEIAVLPYDALVLGWTRRLQARVSVTAKGRTADGTELERTWRADRAATPNDQRSAAAFTLGAFQGGHITQVIITGGVKEAEAAVCHKLR